MNDDIRSSALSWAFSASLVLLALGGCSGDVAGAGQAAEKPPHTPTAPNGPPAHEMGGACDVDSDCSAGNLCLLPGVGIGAHRYCAPACNTNDDCQAFAESSYNITVPDTVSPQGASPTASIYQGTTLARGHACNPVQGRMGRYCQFACSDTEALSGDGHCYCLPGYAQNDEGTECVFSEKIQCSIFSLAPTELQQTLLSKYGIQSAAPHCDACNSDTTFTSGVGCHTGLFTCELNDVGLKGRCVEALTSGALHACILQSTNFTCNCENSCSDACDIGDARCIDNCCTCTASPTSPAPACQSGGGGAAGSGGMPNTSGQGGAPSGGAGGAPSTAGTTGKGGTPPDAGIDGGHASGGTGSARRDGGGQGG
jgi:hypothetical protein